MQVVDGYNDRRVDSAKAHLPSIPHRRAKTWYIGMVYRLDYRQDISGIPGQGPGNTDEGYIRTLIHVSSLVLRLQSYIVTCVYLLDYRDSLLDYNLTTTTNRPILRYRSIRRSTWHRSSIPSKGQNPQ